MLLKWAQCLSWKTAYRVGTGIGHLLYRLKLRRDVAMTNLDIVYGKTKPPSEKERIYRESLLNLGRIAVNYLRLPYMGPDFWENNWEWKNEEILKNAETDAERKKLMKQAEAELKDEFEDDLRKLTFKQGLILIKLVDRETGSSSYVLVQELRGKFVAFFWQTFARFFGYNLKTEYDPHGADREIEEIVVMIENGQI